MAKMTFTDYGAATSKAWMGDFENREHMLPGGGMLDASAFTLFESSFTVTVNDADVNAAETAITVVALPGALPAGTILEFSDGAFAQLSAAAAAAATSITVQALASDVTNAATAIYDPDPASDIIPAGTIVGRTSTESGSGDPFGPFDDADNEIFLTGDDADLSDGDAGVNLVRSGSLVKYNFLPSWSAASAAAKAALRVKYAVIEG